MSNFDLNTTVGANHSFGGIDKIVERKISRRPGVLRGCQGALLLLLLVSNGLTAGICATTSLGESAIETDVQDEEPRSRLQI